MQWADEKGLAHIEKIKKWTIINYILDVREGERERDREGGRQNGVIGRGSQMVY